MLSVKMVFIPEDVFFAGLKRSRKKYGKTDLKAVNREDFRPNKTGWFKDLNPAKFNSLQIEIYLQLTI